LSVLPIVGPVGGFVIIKALFYRLYLGNILDLTDIYHSHKTILSYIWQYLFGFD